VCVSVCLVLCVVACTLPLVGRFLPAKKGQKHPRLRLTSLDSTKIDITRGGRGSNRTGGLRVDAHTHTSGNVGEGWGRIFPLAISMSSIKFLIN
jgi:hypothetical protein